MKEQQLDRVFAALSDSTRRGILSRLAKGSASVAELAKPFRVSQPAISKHLKVLQDADLISSQIDGQRRLRELKTEPLIQAVALIEKYREAWEASYQRLNALLEDLNTTPKKRNRNKSTPSKKA